MRCVTFLIWLKFYHQQNFNSKIKFVLLFFSKELEQHKYELKLKVERLQEGNDSRVVELQADLIALSNELKTLRSNSETDNLSKRETVAGLTEENEKLHSEIQKVRPFVIYISTPGE